MTSFSEVEEGFHKLLEDLTIDGKKAVENTRITTPPRWTGSTVGFVDLQDVPKVAPALRDQVEVFEGRCILTFGVKESNKRTNLRPSHLVDACLTILKSDRTVNGTVRRSAVTAPFVKFGMANVPKLYHVAQVFVGFNKI